MKRFVLFLFLVISSVLLLNYQSTTKVYSDSILTTKTNNFIQSVGGRIICSDTNNNVLNTIFETNNSINLYTISNTPGYEIEKSVNLSTANNASSIIFKKVSYYNFTYICTLINNKDILKLTSKIRIKTLVNGETLIYEKPTSSLPGSILSIEGSSVDVFEISLLDINDNELYIKTYN
ncbi:MAG: hypothetical protein RSB66_01085 [Clostridium sp.]